MQTPITYVKGDLFSVEEGVLAHACNCHGAWGGGIAAEFKRRFPKAYATYHKHCSENPPEKLLGTCELIPDGKYKIACLFTSDGHSPSEVAHYTQCAVADLTTQLEPNTPVNMPQINAGIFGIPWSITAAALEQVHAPITVYVL